MNANTYDALVRNRDQRMGGATAAATDARSAAVIAEAEANRQREQATAVMDDRAILKEFGAKSFEDSIFATLRFLNAPAPQHRLVVGSRFSGREDRVVSTMSRHDLAFWRERFDEVATRLGYKLR